MENNRRLQDWKVSTTKIAIFSLTKTGSSSVSDVQFLKTKLHQWTGETAEPHFQTFDDEWEEWLEVEDDFKAGNKQRVQVVLSSATHNRATGNFRGS